MVRKETFHLTTHSTHFIYGYMATDIWFRTTQIARGETRCCHMGYSFRLATRVLLYAPSHRQDSTYKGLCYTSCGALAGTRNSCHVVGFTLVSPGLSTDFGNQLTQLNKVVLLLILIFLIFFLNNKKNNNNKTDVSCRFF